MNPRSITTVISNEELAFLEDAVNKLGPDDVFVAKFNGPISEFSFQAETNHLTRAGGRVILICRSDRGNSFIVLPNEMAIAILK